MASPSMEDLYHKSCALAEDPQELRDGFQHPARLVKVICVSALGVLGISSCGTGFQNLFIQI